MAKTNTFAEEQAQMLQVALTPASVSFQLVQETRWGFLVAAWQIIGRLNFPTGPPHQRCFYEIVIENFATQRRLTR